MFSGRKNTETTIKYPHRIVHALSRQMIFLIPYKITFPYLKKKAKETRRNPCFCNFEIYSFSYHGHGMTVKYKYGSPIVLNFTRHDLLTSFCFSPQYNSSDKYICLC
jgi:hypothetical protein